MVLNTEAIIKTNNSTSSDLLTLIQLFLSCFITFIENVLTVSSICWFYNNILF